MKLNSFLSLIVVAALWAADGPAFAQSAQSAAAEEIDREVTESLKGLYARTPAAKSLEQNAKAVLVFPDIVKGGLIVGGQYGKGALRQGSRTAGYYETLSGSYGLQAGAQRYGYALFFMTDTALAYVEQSAGWEIGVGPSVVIVDTGTAKALSTTTTQSDIYAFIFDQQGLMAGMGLQGSKINRINP